MSPAAHRRDFDVGAVDSNVGRDRIRKVSVSGKILPTMKAMPAGTVAARLSESLAPNRTRMVTAAGNPRAVAIRARSAESKEVAVIAP